MVVDMQELKQGYNLCRIYKKAQIIKNFSETVFHKVDEVPPISTTHQME